MTTQLTVKMSPVVHDGIATEKTLGRANTLERPSPERTLAGSRDGSAGGALPGCLTETLLLIEISTFKRTTVL